MSLLTLVKISVVSHDKSKFFLHVLAPGDHSRPGLLYHVALPSPGTSSSSVWKIRETVKA